MSVHPYFLSISRYLPADLCAVTHKRTRCLCCCCYSSVCICLPLSDTSQPYSQLQVSFRNLAPSFSTSIIGSYSLVKKELGNECRIRETRQCLPWMSTIQTICHQQVCELPKPDKYILQGLSMSIHGQIMLQKNVEIFLGLNVNFSTHNLSRFVKPRDHKMLWLT